MKTQLTIPDTASEVRLHYKRPLFNDMAYISCAEDAVKYMRQFVNPEQLDLRECFWVMLLTNANRILAISKVASGTTNGVAINIKYILQLTLLSNSNAIVIFHNHPSGTLTISKSDRKQTEKIKQLLDFMEVTLLDHIIITSEAFVSFAQEGEL